MSSILQKLEQNRTQILLAEIGAYLHDLGKARKEFVEHYAQEGGSGWDGHNFLSNFPEDIRNPLTTIEVEVCSEKVKLMDIIEQHHKEKEDNSNRKDCEIPPLIRLLYAGWNGYDGMDSGIDKGSARVKQSKNNIFISTAFGHESEENKMGALDTKKRELYKAIEDAFSVYKTDTDVIKLRKTILKDTKQYYRDFLGETRRPANDVTLLDHSYSVATLFKCAIAKNIVDCSNASFDPLDFNWKILSINLDILSLLSKGIKIGDIKGYKVAIENAFNKAKNFVENTYPIGNEIYRDTSGIYFLVADIETKELEQKLYRELSTLEPELMPAIMIKSTHCGDNNYQFTCNNTQQQILSEIKSQRRNLETIKKEELIRILPQARETSYREICYPAASRKINLAQFQNNWKDREICPICRLHPMKENSDGCDYCLKRRTKRAEEWIKESSGQSIWLDEVSDHNDRVALIIGAFVLDDWLNGSFIKTMAIAIRNNVPTPKHPSPARIRRCWETTQEFFQNTVLDHILNNYPYAKDAPNRELRDKRIKITISPLPQVSEDATIDVDIDGVRLSPVCIDESNGIFITTTNLQILSSKGKTVDELTSWMNGKEIKIKHEKDNKWNSGYRITNANPAESKFQDYLPYVPIYDFPDQFMVLVPAYDALEIAKKIVNAYEIHISKVRDRLPFHVGVIAFHRRTPLYVAMDAGRRIIDAFRTKTKTINARVGSIADVQHSKLGPFVKELTLIPDPCYSTSHFIWQISHSTGDPDQEDEWHPYIRVNEKHNQGNYSFDYDGNGNYVVHVKELKPNDCIKVEPSYLKITFLEKASDRFRIDKNLRPIDDIKRLEEIWDDLQGIVDSKGIGIAQIYAFWQDVKKRYEEYSGDVVWENFVKSSLTNIFKLSPVKDSELFNKLFQATKDGLLDLCLYWNLQVRKIKLEKQEAKS